MRPAGSSLGKTPVGDGSAWPANADPTAFRPTERTNGNNFGVSFEPSRN